MAIHRIDAKLPKMDVANVDVTFIVYSDNAKLGELHVSRGFHRLEASPCTHSNQETLGAVRRPNVGRLRVACPLQDAAEPPFAARHGRVRVAHPDAEAANAADIAQ